MQTLSAAPTLPSLPPGRAGWLTTWDMLEAWSDPLPTLRARVAEYGDVSYFRVGPLQYVVVNSPDAVHHVLVENHKNYVKSRNYAGLKVVLGRGLLTAEGEDWRNQRKLIQPGFHRERLSGFAETMVKATDLLVDRWQSNPTVDVHQEMSWLTFKIVGETLFSADLDGEAREFGQALTLSMDWANEFAESLVRIPWWVPTPNNLRFMAARKKIETLAQRLIEEHRQTPKPDLLGMLLDARDESGQPMSDEQIRQEALTLLIAGHETTANALTFTLYLLSQHLQVQQKLQAEVDQVLGGRPVTLADLPKLPYTKMVLDESMRLYPPAWIVERDALEEDVVSGFRVPKGATVGISTYLLHRHPDYWEQPEAFVPERFAEASQRPKHIYLPFGGGPRTCIGNAFALMEMQLVLARLTQRAQLELAPGTPLALKPSITLRPAHPVLMRQTAR